MAQTVEKIMGKITKKKQNPSLAYIAIGSNMGNRYENLKKALDAVSSLDSTSLHKLSNIYETQPVGYLEQNRFLNMVMSITTELDPLPLLKRLQEIENKMGRKRLISQGPRIIDLDILMYNNQVVNFPELQIPHPEMLKRAFVLIPLRDIEPSMEINGICIDRYIDACNDKRGVDLYALL